MARTERQKIVDHFVDKGIVYDKTIDMAFYLARDHQGSKKIFGSNEYVAKVLKAGYTSKMAEQLRDDIKTAVESPKGSEDEK